MNVLRSDPRRAAGRALFVPDDASRIVDGGIGKMRSAVSRPAEDPLMARRRGWFVRALGAFVVTLVVAAVVGGWAWLLFGLVAGVTAGYTAVLRHHKVERDRARHVVRELDVGAPIDVDVPIAVGDGAVSSVRLRRWNG